MNEVFGDVAGEVEAEREGRSTSCLTKEELPEEEIHHNQTILEEVFTPDYNVTEEGRIWIFFLLFNELVWFRSNLFNYFDKFRN